MRNDLLLIVPYIDGGLEKLDFLVGELRSSDSTQQLLRLARKHRTANNFNPTLVVASVNFIF